MEDAQYEVSVYQVFCEHFSLVSDHDSEVHVSGCPSCSYTPLEDEDGVLFRKGSTTHHRTKEFRAATASLRFHTLSIPQTTISDSVENKYIVPVMRFAERYMFRVSQLRYELKTSPDFTEVLIWMSKDEWQSRKALASLLVVPKGTVCWRDFLFPSEGGNHYDLACTRNLQIIRKIRKLWNDYSPHGVVLTDELQACIVRELTPYPGECDVQFNYLTFGDLSLRCVLGGLLNEVGLRGDYFDPKMQVELLQGALNVTPDKAGLPSAINPGPSGFQDFDLFTMQRSLPDARRFLDWKAKLMQETLSHPLVVGDSLQVDVDAFAEREPLLCFNLPLQKPPAESLQLVMTHPRSRQVEIDHFLDCGNSGGNLFFRIDQFIRTKPETFSQVFFGHLCRVGNSESAACETRICVKLFDEVFFPVFDPLEVDNIEESECNREIDLNAASDMMRREHAVYQHLQYLQGTLLPHVYGFHLFTLPDGRKIWGFFSEIIEGTPLSDVQLDQLTESLQKDLVRRLRHGVRTLLYGGVLQGDWHLGQIFVNWVAGPNENAEPEPAIVFIDFAFIWLRLGLGNVAPHFPQPDGLWLELYGPELRHAVLSRDIWLDTDDFEW